jgi:hypothetical protein
MGNVAEFIFNGFPDIDGKGVAQLKSGRVIVEECSGGWVPRHLELDGVDRLTTSTRAVVASWLHMRHERGIRRLLAEKAAGN